MSANGAIPYHHDGGHIAALTSPLCHSGRQLATSCVDVPKPPPLTAATAITAHLRATSKSTHGRWQAVEAAHRHHPMLPTNASSYYKCAATILAPSWCRPPRVAPPPAVMSIVPTQLTQRDLRISPEQVPKLLKKSICSLWDIVYHFICKIRFGGRFDAAMLESWFSRFTTGPTSVPVPSAGTRVP